MSQRKKSCINRLDSEYCKEESIRGVCRRVLRNADDADDAFQAAFLVLLRQASALAMREVIGDWLHGVAYRTALKARTAEARRRIKEKQAPRCEAILEQEESPEWLPLLDQEIGRLPEKYRLPVVLCDLQGRTRKQAAQQLGWPEGTLSGRLCRARAMLARRLIRRGVTLSVGALTMGLVREASARLPFSLVGSTCKAARGFAVGSAAEVVPAHIAALTEGVVKAMLLAKLKTAAVLVTGAIVLGVGAWRYAAAEQAEKRTQVLPTPVPTAPDVGKKQDAKIRPMPRDPSAIHAFQIDLEIFEVKNGRRKVLMEPHFLTLEGETAAFASGDSRTIQLGGGKTEEVVIGPFVRTVVRSNQGGKIRLDVTVSQPERAIVGDATILETKTVRYINDMTLGEPTRLQHAMGDKTPAVLEVTATVRKAKVRIEMEEKSPARVGQIFIIGNKKTSDKVILKQVPLFPGQILIYADLRIYEQNLSRLKGFKSKPKVSVIDREGDGAFKDIRITVEEK